MHSGKVVHCHQQQGLPNTVHQVQCEVCRDVQTGGLTHMPLLPLQSHPTATVIACWQRQVCHHCSFTPSSATGGFF
jgi:hypothetical protein